jgi:hypothetical protein
MTATERSELALAAKLLAKAQSTDSNEEATALSLRAYSLLADWLNRQEAAAGGPRRRERRLLLDRRSLRQAFRVLVPAASSTSGRDRPYASPEAPPRQIDLRA